MDYLTKNHIDYREKCNHIFFDYKLDDNIIRETMNCTSHDGNYNVQGVYFLDENLDLDTVHFEKYRKRFVIEIKNERAFYISIGSDDSYAFNLNTR